MPRRTFAAKRELRQRVRLRLGPERGQLCPLRAARLPAVVRVVVGDLLLGEVVLVQLGGAGRGAAAGAGGGGGGGGGGHGGEGGEEQQEGESGRHDDQGTD